MQRVSKSEALEILESFTKEIYTVMLSTVDENGEPFSSYAPFVEDKEHNYYVGLSSLVPHTHNIETTKKAHIMFIEDESKAKGMFFRRRLYSKVNASLVSNEVEKENISKMFEERFPGEGSMVVNLPDFKIFKLSGKDFSFVLGFGAAFEVSEDRKTLRQKTGK